MLLACLDTTPFQEDVTARASTDPPPDEWTEADQIGVAESALNPGESAPPGAPVWHGETEPLSDAYACPLYIPEPLRAYRNGHWFSGPAVWVYISAATPGSVFPLLPHGTYAPVGGIIRSEDGTREFSGYFIIACRGDFEVTTSGMTVWLGQLFAVGTLGTDYPVNGGGGGFEHNGWAYKDVTVESGVGAGWQTALNAYLGSGACTAGWEIWVDGDQKCKADGTAV